MGSLSFDTSISAVPLHCKKGIAAFDPVTLLLAAHCCAEKIVSLGVPAALDAPRPQAFTDLATIEVGCDERGFPKVVATIDTGQMSWSTRIPPRESIFIDYSGRPIKAVEFTKAAVAQDTDLMVTTLPMQLPNGEEIDAWFAELPAPIADLDGLALMQLVQQAMVHYHSCGHLRAMEVHIPEQKIDYDSDISTSVTCAAPILVLQEFNAHLDVHGARVKAATTIAAGSALRNVEPPPIARFGERGPVLWWLTEKQANTQTLPFAVIYSESEAWQQASAG